MYTLWRGEYGALLDNAKLSSYLSCCPFTQWVKPASLSLTTGLPSPGLSQLLQFYLLLPPTCILSLSHTKLKGVVDRDALYSSLCLCCSLFLEGLPVQAVSRLSVLCGPPCKPLHLPAPSVTLTPHSPFCNLNFLCSTSSHPKLCTGPLLKLVSSVLIPSLEDHFSQQLLKE